MKEETRPVKQVIVIRKDLKMRRGKEIAQGAHAAMAWLTDRLRKMGTPGGIGEHLLAGYLSEAEAAWVRGSFRKVVVQVPGEEELLAVLKKARALQPAPVLAYLITDAGLTEFGGTATNTAVAVGPDYDDLVDQVTGDLELY